MAKRTQLLSIIPWNGGINTSQNEGLIAHSELIRADNIVFSTSGSRVKREGINHNWDDASTSSVPLIGLGEFWYESGSTKVQKFVSVDTNGKFYSYDPSSGDRTDISGSDAWTSPTKAALEQYFNLLILTADGSSNNIKFWNGTDVDVDDLADHPSYGGGDPNPPNASIVRAHLGRLWTNDRDNPDRVHYCETNNPLKWIGAGDSGALDIGIGDGDPDGITAIFPSFKGSLFVAKRTKLYRISGFTPETFRIEQISDSIGCISHNTAISVDQDDIFWLSDRGVHSLAATDRFGDFEGAFISNKIQRTFNDDFDKTEMKKAWGAYIPDLNSVVFTFSDTAGDTADELWFYNIQNKAWYRWPELSCTSLMVSTDSDRPRLYLGTEFNRISRTFSGAVSDTDLTGTSVAVVMRIITGVIFPNKNAYSINGFKKLALLYQPGSSYTLTTKVKIDNLPEQTVTFTDAGASPLLGTTFTLGTSILGVNRAPASFTRTIDGYGRGIKITIEQQDLSEEMEIHGLMVEFEPSGDSQETVVQA